MLCENFRLEPHRRSLALAIGAAANEDRALTLESSMRRVVRSICGVVCVLGFVAAQAQIAGRTTQTPSVQAPADLKPLLAAPVSEARLVVTRYNADRNTLSGDYVTSGGRGGGRQGGGRAGGGGGPVLRRRRLSPVQCRSPRRASRA